MPVRACGDEMEVQDDDNDDDDHDCKFVKHPNIHGKPMLVAHAGAVSLMDENRKHGQSKGQRDK